MGRCNKSEVRIMSEAMTADIVELNNDGDLIDERDVEHLGRFVKVSNQFVRAYLPSKNVWEIRVITAVASLVSSSDEDFHTYRIPLSYISKSLQQTMSRNYREIRKSINEIVKLTITIVNEEAYKVYSIFSMCGIEKKTNTLIAQFHPDLKPFFLNLQREFTVYHTKDIMELRSVYQQKLYMLLKSWYGLNEYTITLEELHKYLDTPKSLRDSYGNFKKRVLIPTQKNLSEVTMIKFSFVEIKKGKGLPVVKIKFLFKEKEKNDSLREMLECKKNRSKCFDDYAGEKCDLCVLYKMKENIKK